MENDEKITREPLGGRRTLGRGTEVEEARVNKVKRVNRGERTVSGKQRDEVGAAVAPNMRERERLPHSGALICSSC